LRRIAAYSLELLARNSLCIDIAVQGVLIQRIAAFHDNVLHLVSKTRLTGETHPEIAVLPAVMPFSNRDQRVGIKKRQ